MDTAELKDRPQHSNASQVRGKSSWGRAIISADTEGMAHDGKTSAVGIAPASLAAGFPLAVSLFNDPGRERALEGFIVHMPGDLSLQFVNQQDLTLEQQRAAEDIAAAGGYVITKTKTEVVTNADKFKPGHVARIVEDAIPFRFKPSHEMSHFWRKHKVRPAKKDPNPKNTKAEWCVYDTAHSDYLYYPGVSLG